MTQNINPGHLLAYLSLTDKLKTFLDRIEGMPLPLEQNASQARYSRLSKTKHGRLLLELETRSILPVFQGMSWSAGRWFRVLGFGASIRDFNVVVATDATKTVSKLNERYRKLFSTYRWRPLRPELDNLAEAWDFVMHG